VTSNSRRRNHERTIGRGSGTKTKSYRGGKNMICEYGTAKKLRPTIVNPRLKINWTYFEDAILWNGTFHTTGEALLGWTIIKGKEFCHVEFFDPKCESHPTLEFTKDIIIKGFLDILIRSKT
jgi:hypothetical protein